jgi:hypothetical protein
MGQNFKGSVLAFFLLFLTSGCCSVFGIDCPSSPDPLAGYQPLQNLKKDGGDTAGAKFDGTNFFTNHTNEQVDNSLSSDTIASDANFNANILAHFKNAVLGGKYSSSDATNLELSNIEIVTPNEDSYGLLPAADGEDFVLSAIVASCYSFTSSSASAASIEAALNATPTATNSPSTTATPSDSGSSCSANPVAGSASSTTDASAAGSPGSGIASVQVGAGGDATQVKVAVRPVEEQSVSANPSSAVLDFPNLGQQSFAGYAISPAEQLDTGHWSGAPAGGQPYTGPSGFACISVTVSTDNGGYPVNLELCPLASNIIGAPSLGYVRPNEMDTYTEINASNGGDELCRLEMDSSGVKITYQTPSDQSYKEPWGHLTPISMTGLAVKQLCFKLVSKTSFH